MTKKPKRVMTKASKAGCRSAGGLRTKLGEDFLAHLNRSWELHGREILARVWAERPELYFKALVKLTLALHRATGEPTDFDRRRNREEVLRRLRDHRPRDAAFTRTLHSRPPRARHRALQRWQITSAPGRASGALSEPD